MKVACITDIHFGKQTPSTDAFENYVKSFYENVFFPELETRGIDTVIDLGDTFDKRKTIDFRAWTFAKSVFFDELKRRNIKVHAIVGNHTVYYKNTNALSSMALILEPYDNVQLYSDPQEVVIGGTKFFMLPWLNNSNFETSIDMAVSSAARVLISHLELRGFSMHPGVVSETGMSSEPFAHFDLVLSGHFHTKSQVGRINYLGAPFEYTWIDYGDPKGFHILDTDTLELEYIRNPYTFFEKCMYDQSAPLDVEFYRNKIVKMIVLNKENNQQFDEDRQRLQAVAADFRVVDSVQVQLIHGDHIEGAESTLDTIVKYVDNMTTNLSQDKLKTHMTSLYIEAESAL